ncbi:hypothetical protein F5B17DRAFT_379428 [Nemania serpens]|nr:hypothetical protein F5B17DRAFT_379428 [Nemania serpens]
MRLRFVSSSSSLFFVFLQLPFCKLCFYSSFLSYLDHASLLVEELGLLRIPGIMARFGLPCIYSWSFHFHCSTSSMILCSCLLELSILLCSYELVSDFEL